MDLKCIARIILRMLESSFSTNFTIFIVHLLKRKHEIFFQLHKRRPSISLYVLAPLLFFKILRKRKLYSNHFIMYLPVSVCLIDLNRKWLYGLKQNFEHIQIVEPHAWSVFVWGWQMNTFDYYNLQIYLFWYYLQNEGKSGWWW